MPTRSFWNWTTLVVCWFAFLVLFGTALYCWSRTDREILDVVIAAASLMVAVVVAFMGAVPIVAEKQREIDAVDPHLVHQIILNRPVLQCAAIESKKLSDAPIIWIDRAKDASGKNKLLPLENVEKKISVVDWPPPASASSHFAIDESKSASDISAKYGLRLYNDPAFIFQDVLGHARLSESGSIKFARGSYFDSWEACDLPIWKAAEKVVNENLYLDAAWPFLVGENGHLRRALRSSFLQTPIGRKNERFKPLDEKAKEALRKFFWEKYKINAERIDGFKKFLIGERSGVKIKSGMGIATLTIAVLKQNEPQFLLLSRTADGNVAESVGMKSVIPSGGYAPNLYESESVESKIWYNIAREFYEEIMEHRCNKAHCEFDSKTEKFRLTRDADSNFNKFLNGFSSNRDTGKLKIFYLGLGLDVLSGRPNLLTALLIHPELLQPGELLDMSKWRDDFEGSLAAKPFNKSELDKLLPKNGNDCGASRLSPSGYGCIERASENFELLKSEADSLRAGAIANKTGQAAAASFNFRNLFSRGRIETPLTKHRFTREIARLNGTRY